jgi:hypothetical protein
MQGWLTSCGFHGWRTLPLPLPLLAMLLRLVRTRNLWLLCFISSNNSLRTLSSHCRTPRSVFRRRLFPVVKSGLAPLVRS